MRIFYLFLLFIIHCTPLLALEKSLLMATTTSTDNTGFLDYLEKVYKTETGIDFKWTATGTGKALKLGKNCDVDILLVHAPSAEKIFVDNGFGTSRTETMYNDFLLVGPKSDPAGIKGKHINTALQTIYNKKVSFASRGDNSGTHEMEINLWKSLGVTDFTKQEWYKETGQGMINTLNIAAEIGGYTITDRGTYIKYESNFKGDPPLVIVVEGDKKLFNQYSLIPVNPKRCPNVKIDMAEDFVKWMTSPKIQKKIGDFKLLNKQLFIPNAK